MRKAEIKRETRETNIALSINLDGKGEKNINTGVGFFDHMLECFAVHGCFDLNVEAKGDLYVDDHHTIEDVGICLGKAFAEAAGDLKGIKRFATFFVPMDESLARVSLDFSKRPYLVYDVPETELYIYEEFFRAFAFNAGLTLHIGVLYGKNAHHIIEAVFKACARALREALSKDDRIVGVASSKGVL